MANTALGCRDFYRHGNAQTFSPARRTISSTICQLLTNRLRHRLTCRAEVNNDVLD